MNISGALAVQGLVFLVVTVFLICLLMDVKGKWRARVIALAAIAGVLCAASFIACGWFGVTS